MSADNGIYILRTKRTRVESSPGTFSEIRDHYVWRVAHAQAIENFDYIKHHEPHNLGAYMRDVWGKSKVYMTEEEAVAAAWEEYDKHHIVEYGVSDIETDLVFYGDM